MHEDRPGAGGGQGGGQFLGDMAALDHAAKHQLSPVLEDLQALLHQGDKGFAQFIAHLPDAADFHIHHFTGTGKDALGIHALTVVQHFS